MVRESQVKEIQIPDHELKVEVRRGNQWIEIFDL